jgi:hypothetical protein
MSRKTVPGFALGAEGNHVDDIDRFIHGRAYSLTMLKCLNDVYRARGVGIYMGTVPGQVIARRRAKNKRARRARRLNRG